MEDKLKAVYEFLRARYKHERFEGRSGSWCPNYGEVVATSCLESLEKYGYSLIGPNESVTGEGVYFDADLVVWPTYKESEARGREIIAKREKMPNQPNKPEEFDICCRCKIELEEPEDRQFGACGDCVSDMMEDPEKVLDEWARGEWGGIV